MRILSVVVILAACAHAAPQASVGTSTSPKSGKADVTIGLVRDPKLAAALGDISAARIRATDSTLAAFGTRHAMSDTMSSTRGVGAARRWIFSTLSSYSSDCAGCLRIEYDPAMVTIQRDPQKRSVNIVN